MRYIQLAGDALIPLMGFFLWNWSLYFIVLFYLADLVIDEVFTNLKAGKIKEYNDNKRSSAYWKYSSLFLLAVAVFLIHLALSLFHPGIDFPKEIIAFWNYRDMGIEQGYILLPLLILIAYQRYKVEFLMPARYRDLELNQFWKKHLRSYLALIAGVGLAIGSTVIYPFPDIVLLFGIILGSTGYQILVQD